MNPFKYVKSEFTYKGTLYAAGDLFPMDVLDEEDRNDIFFRRLMDTPESVNEIEPDPQPVKEKQPIKKKKRSKT
jgi:hypothetical protein